MTFTDWTWLKNHGSHSKKGKHGNNQKEMLDTFKENFDQIRQHELHMKEKQKRKHKKGSDENSEEIESGDIFIGDRYKLKAFEDGDKNAMRLLIKHGNSDLKFTDEIKSSNGKNHNRLEGDSLTMLKTWQKLLRPHFPDGKIRVNDDKVPDVLKKNGKENDLYDPNHLKFDENGILIKNFGFTKIEDNVKIEKLIDDIKFSEDFSTTEKFILDWQTVILGIAVSSCIIFFLVAAIYSIQHAKHWKKLRNYFDAGESI